MSRTIKLALAAIAIVAPVSQVSAARLFGLSYDLFTGTYAISTFDSNSSGTETTRGIVTGLASGSILVGLDQRPANRTLYTLSSNGQVYTLNLSTGGNYTATLVNTLSTTLNGTDFGFDFNPVGDRLRITSNTNQNLNHNVNAGGTTLSQTAITLNGSPNIDLVGAAYTNSRAGVASTTLYGIDTVNDRLVVTSNPGGGAYTTVGGVLGIPQGISNFNEVGFDISGATGEAFLNVDAQLYSVNLTSGAATNLGTIASGPLIDIAASAVPEPATWAMMIGGFGMVGGAMRRRRRASVRRAELLA